MITVELTPAQAKALLLSSEWIAAWMRLDRDDWIAGRDKIREALGPGWGRDG